MLKMKEEGIAGICPHDPVCAALVPHLATKDTVRGEVTVVSFCTPILRMGVASKRDEHGQNILHGPSQPLGTVVVTGTESGGVVANVRNCFCFLCGFHVYIMQVGASGLFCRLLC